MAKKGGSRHYKRIRLPRLLPISARKSPKWMLSPTAGPHPKKRSIALGSLLRDVLKIGDDLRECKRVLSSGNVLVDGKIVRNIRRPIGIMDIVSLPKEGRAWRLQIVKGRLLPSELASGSAAAKFKLCKVVKKTTVPGGKISITTHDGRTMLADNNVKVGSTLKLSIPSMKISGQIPLAPGARCLITEGKHSGELAILESIIERTGSMDPEARMRAGSEAFVTLTKYVFAVDDEFQ